jgi:hypothetical protein
MHSAFDYRLHSLHHTTLSASNWLHSEHRSLYQERGQNGMPQRVGSSDPKQAALGYDD